MDYLPNYPAWDGIFAVPAALADRLLKACSESQLKVLLLALRALPSAPDTAEIARRLSITPEAAADCLDYWVGSGLLLAAGASPSAPPCAEAAEAPSAAGAVEERTASTGQTVTTVHSRAKLTPRQINDLCRSGPELSQMLTELQRLLGKTLSPGETESAVWIYSTLRLPPDYILLAAQYCIQNGRGRMRYVEQLITGWVDEGIDSYTAAEIQVERLQRRRENEGVVRTMFGITGRELSTREKSYIERWFSEFLMPPELVKLAYDRAVDNTGRLAFAYINKILSDWYAKGIRTVADAVSESSQPDKKGADGMDAVKRRMERKLYGG